MPVILLSSVAERKTPDGPKGREVIGTLTILMMKHPPQNRRRVLQAETRAAEPNSGDLRP
jgi:hypothetical protein